MNMVSVTEELAGGRRFGFGENWRKYLASLDERRIDLARSSLCALLNRSELVGSRFLDMGCGSGLFSLAAAQLGATVVSVDYDPDSVGCAEQLRAATDIPMARWDIREGSVLDRSLLDSLGSFDIVYSWGVLHHTGHLWEAARNVGELVSPGGLLALAIYNDQGGASRRWRLVKRLYNSFPVGLRWIILWPAACRLLTPIMLRRTLRGTALDWWRSYPRFSRGMSPWRDVVDWVGGYPFEVAKPEEVIDAVRSQAFALQKLKTCGGGHGCNEFVFLKQ